jgi:hypothetical protein
VSALAAVQSGARATFDRAVFEGGQAVGVGVLAGSEVTVTDAVFRRTRRQIRAAPHGSRTITIQLGGRVVLRRVVVEDSEEFGIDVAGGALEATDLVIRDVRPASDARWGVGLVVWAGADAMISRSRIERTGFAGVIVDESTLEATDLVIAEPGAHPTADDRGGFGLVVQRRSTAAMERAEVVRARYAAIGVGFGGSVLDARDVLVHDTESGRGDGFGGGGLVQNASSSVRIENGVFERNRDATIIAWGADVRTELIRVRVSDTLPRSCATTTCVDHGAGTGIGAYLGAHVTATDFVIQRSSLCGVQIATDGAMDLARGRIEDNAFGACVQVDPYDLQRLSADVIYRGNGSNLESTSLPVPSVSEDPLDTPDR